MDCLNEQLCYQMFKCPFLHINKTKVHLIYHDYKHIISKRWYVDIYLNFEKQ